MHLDAYNVSALSCRSFVWISPESLPHKNSSSFIRLDMTFIRHGIRLMTQGENKCMWSSAFLRALEMRMRLSRVHTSTKAQQFSLIHPSIHPLSVTALSLLWDRGGLCWSQSQLSLGEGRVHPGQVASSSQGTHWWQRLPCKVPTAHQEQFGVQYLAQGHFDM